MYKSMSPLMFNRKNTVTIILVFCVGEIYQHVSRGIHRQIAPSDTQYCCCFKAIHVILKNYKTEQRPINDEHSFHKSSPRVLGIRIFVDLLTQMLTH
jgi:hypothetical protein